MSKNAAKMRAYRARKRKKADMGNAYSVTACLSAAKKTGDDTEVREILDMCYDAGGMILVEKVAIELYRFHSALNHITGQTRT